MDDMNRLEQEQDTVTQNQQSDDLKAPEPLDNNEKTDEEKLLAAGYLPKPTDLNVSKPMSHKILRAELKDVAVPVPRDYYTGNMNGDNKVKIYESRGHDLFGDGTQALVDIIKAYLPDAAIDKLPAKYLDNSESNSIEIESKEHKNTNYGAILKHKIARDYNITLKDMSLTSENEIEVQKLLTGNDLTLVEPWSIEGGIIGANDECLLLFDDCDQLSGQPGGLLAIYKSNFFTSAPISECYYDPHTYTVHYQSESESQMKCRIINEKQYPFLPSDCEVAQEMIVT